MKTELRGMPIDPWREISAYRQALPAQCGRYGATAVFVGTMRDLNAGHQVRSMFLEHYPGMTEQYLQRISDEAEKKWDILDLLVLHRCGEINPDDTIVVIAAWAAHRDDAFKACRYIIEELKQRAPFWKKETRLADNSNHWVTTNTPT